MKKIGIIGAMSVEVNYLVDLMMAEGSECHYGPAGMSFEEGTIHGVSAVVCKSGVGKVNAALCAQILILKYGCTHIINTGIAGAMASGLGIMDFVVSTDAVYHDMDATGFGYKVGQVPQMDVYSFPADEKMIEAVTETFKDSEKNVGHKIIAGRIATGDQFISDKAVKAKIKENVAPACVEMEGGAIAHTCFLNKVPFVIVRCMSDMADDLSSNGYEFNEGVAAEMSAKLVEEVVQRI